MPLSMCGRKGTVDDVLQRHGTPSQTEPASTPEAIENQQSSGGPLEKYQCTGTPLSVSFTVPWKLHQNQPDGLTTVPVASPDVP